MRGGERTATRERTLLRWLPSCLVNRLPTDVLPLHLRPVSQFGTEFRRLVDAFEVVCGFEDPDHLNPNVESEPVLCGIADQLHHIFSSEFVSVALRAQ